MNFSHQVKELRQHTKTSQQETYLAYLPVLGGFTNLATENPTLRVWSP